MIKRLRQRFGMVHCHRQRHYVLFGVEIDRDIDATDVAAHLWPVTIEWEWNPIQIIIESADDA